MRYPIVKIDRTTAQEMLPIFINKGIFSNYKALPTKEELLAGHDALTKEEERTILKSAKIYRTKNFIVRNYENYEVGFGLSFLGNDQLTDALGRISLNKLGHKLATIILAEVYIQGKTTELVISKEKLLDYLGYSPSEKQVYSDINDVMYSLMTLNYYIHEYRNNSSSKIKSKELGWFIYDVKSDHKSYTFSVNKNFVGCIENVINNDKKSLGNFSRGYFTYPTSILPASKNYSTPAYLLANLLISDSGNAKLNSDDVKVVAYSVKYLLDFMKIERTRISKVKAIFISAVKEVTIINKTTPSIDVLSAMKPASFLRQTIHFHLIRDMDQLDDLIKSNLLGAK